MNYDAPYQGDQSQNSGTCHRGGITHDQVYTERTTGRVARRCNDDSVTINGDIYLGDNSSSQQRQVNRYDRQQRYDDRDLDTRSYGAQTYGDNYVGSSSRMAELQQQNYYLNQQLMRERQQESYSYGGYQDPRYGGYQDPRYAYRPGINPQTLIGAGIGGVLGMELLGHGRHGSGLGFLAGSLIGGGLANGGGLNVSAEYYGGPQSYGWGSPNVYHYRHESPQMWQQQQYYRMMQQRQAMAYNTYSSGYYDNGYSWN